MSTTIHSKIGASSHHRWKRESCPGSVRESEGITSIESVYAAEGTEAHDMAEKLARNAFHGELNRVGEAHEMRRHVEVYIDCLRYDIQQTQVESLKHHVLIEHSFDLSEVYPGLFGTADCVVFHQKKKLLRVYDYKHGAGIPVSIVDNTQLMYYALGALRTCGFQCEQVELVIVQPRCDHADGPIRRWRISVLDLIDFEEELRLDAKATEAKNPTLKPGSYCNFCPANRKCPALHEKALIAAKEQFKEVLDYSPRELQVKLDMIPAIKNWIKAIEEFAYVEANSGRAIPGYKLVQKRALRKWKDEDETLKYVKKKYRNGEFFEEPKLLSPAKMEKTLSLKAKGKQEMSTFIQSVSSGTTLVVESDKRKEVKTLTAAEQFDELTD